DIPNACATLYIPTAIFDFDITPGTAGPHRVDPGPGVPRAEGSRLPENKVLRAVPKDKRRLLPSARRLAGHGVRPLRDAVRRFGRSSGQ
ncbi:MAG: acetamidase/formamidase family protein, partial [Dietzia cercidiphylli]